MQAVKYWFALFLLILMGAGVVVGWIAWAVGVIAG